MSPAPSLYLLYTDSVTEKLKQRANHTVPPPFYGPLFWDYPGEMVPEESFWTLWSKRRLTEADTLTIWLGTTPSGLTNAYLHHPPLKQKRTRNKNLLAWKIFLSLRL